MMAQTGFWYILLAMGLYGMLHSLLASTSAKALSERWLGLAAQRFYRLFFNIVVSLTLLPVVVLVGFLPDRRIYSIPFPWTLLTLGLQALAGLGLLLGVYQTGGMQFLGLAQLIAPVKEETPARFVSNGLYGYVRHPLYALGLVIIWLAPVMSWNVLAFNLGITLYILAGIQFEERKLLAEFGQLYADYRRRVPMLLPGFKRFK
ncbi:MAG: isoprenylcysteine carboxylmethyltransferase family protein [Planctomycetes bacterium]|nr:isoprenylcysteine carboxylmethyltransferase family protein [Planctomycetota bacterium]